VNLAKKGVKIEFSLLLWPLSGLTQTSEGTDMDGGSPCSWNLGVKKPT
jgi:hypothetical protein